MMHHPITSTGGARRAFGILAGAAALLLTASCASEENIASYPCPVVSPVRELAYMTKFQGDSQDLSDTLFEARVDQVLPAVNCVYEEADDQFPSEGPAMYGIAAGKMIDPPVSSPRQAAASASAQRPPLSDGLPDDLASPTFMLD